MNGLCCVSVSVDSCILQKHQLLCQGKHFDWGGRGVAGYSRSVNQCISRGNTDHYVLPVQSELIWTNITVK